MIVSFLTRVSYAFQRERLLEDWGWTTVKLSSANTHSYDKQDVSLKHYAEHMVKPQRKDTLANGNLDTYCMNLVYSSSGGSILT